MSGQAFDGHQERVRAGILNPMAAWTEKRIVLGAGTGRSGSLSLARLFALQPSAIVSHEFAPVSRDGSLGDRLHDPLPWAVDLDELEDAIRALGGTNGGVRVEVGSYWGPYVPHMVERFGSRLRVIILERDRQEVITSFERKAGDKNHWIDHDGTSWRLNPAFDRAFPHFDEDDRAAAIGRYWDLYHQLSGQLAAAYPEWVRRWKVDVLNSRSGIEEILSFAGFPSSARRVPSSMWENRSRRTFRSVAYAGAQRLAQLFERE